MLWNVHQRHPSTISDEWKEVFLGGFHKDNSVFQLVCMSSDKAVTEFTRKHYHNSSAQARKQILWLSSQETVCVVLGENHQITKVIWMPNLPHLFRSEERKWSITTDVEVAILTHIRDWESKDSASVCIRFTTMAANRLISLIVPLMHFHTEWER